LKAFVNLTELRIDIVVRIDFPNKKVAPTCRSSALLPEQVLKLIPGSPQEEAYA
jgi:hypothetical protein